ncbi:MAG: hypothetical protein OEU74_05135, partial [Gammaproteobacteria bacterium]|nr:hypothetical protein [Gammaproteobacteria bacterium]
MGRSASHLPAVLFFAMALLVTLCGCAMQADYRQANVIHEDAHSGGSLVAFNNAGDLMISGGWEGGVRFWQMPGGALQNSWQAHISSVNGAVFSADGQRVVTAGYDGT